MSKQTHKRQLVQDRAISALAAGKSVEEAADAAGVARSTIFRWRKHPEFEAALARARGESSRKAPQACRRPPVQPYNREPEVVEAAASYLAAARAHHGPEVPVDSSLSRTVPDPRWWLRMRDSGGLHPEVVRASERYERVRVEALQRWRKERDDAAPPR